MILRETTVETGPVPFIYGSETELAVNLLGCKFTDVEDLLENNAGLEDQMHTAIASDIPPNDLCFVSNGGRFYLDGLHLEVSTPECYGLYELVMYELAMEQLAINGLSWLVGQGWVRGFQANKRSSDHTGTLWGAHENCSNQEVVDYQNEQLRSGLRVARLTHQLTRVIYSGEGGLMPSCNNVSQLKFAMSPRIAGTTGEDSGEAMAYPTVCSNYNLDSGTGQRMQNCAGANISPWAIAIKHGMNAVVSMLAHQIPDAIPEIADNIMLRNMIAGSGFKGLETKIHDTDGKSWRPTDVQRHIATEALDKLNLANDEKWACEQVIDVCDVLDRDPQAAVDRVDWVKRLDNLLHSGLPKKPFLIGSRPNVENADFGWDTLAITDIDQRIDQLQGAGLRARRLGWGWHDIEPVSQSEIQAGVNTPSDTRAAERILLLKAGTSEVAYNGTTEQELMNPYGGNL